nr:MAG TPA: replisome organizer [Caudoviricetes sp.]
MAERRMFAKKIIDSDAFLDMPLSTQALYFHLSMRADDEGFINNPKRILRLIGSSDDDMKLLIAKSYIIPFDSGIVVIRHWKINNYLRNDRFTATECESEKAQLTEGKTGIYELGIPKAYQAVDERYPQYSIGKDSIVEYSIGKDSIEGERAPTREPVHSKAQTIVDLFNGLCPSLSKVTVLSTCREKAITARLKEFTVEQFTTVFKKAEASKFLTGRNGKAWRANFDWLINASNFVKVLDGNYDDRAANRDGMSDNPEDDLPF